jgi:hypothetical protein
MAKETIEVTKTEARQGLTGLGVRYVLIGGCLALIVFFY